MKPSRRRRPGRTILRNLAHLLIAATVVLLFLQAFGLPDWLMSAIISRANSRYFAIEPGRVRLDVLRGVVADDVRVYRKTVVGPPAFEARRVVLRLDPFAWLKEETCLRRIRIYDGVYRPELAYVAGTVADPKPYRKTKARLEVYGFHIQGLDVERGECKLRVDGYEVRIDEATGTVSNGTWRGEVGGYGNFDTRTREVRVHLSAAVDPHALLSIMEAWDLTFMATLTRRFEFVGPPPRCDVDFSKVCLLNGDFYCKARYWIQDCAYRGVQAKRADGDVVCGFTNGVSTVTLRPLLVVRPEGIAEGGLHVDTSSDTVRFDFVSTLNPKALLGMIGVFTKKTMDIFRFDGPVRAVARGVVDYDDLSDTDFVVAVDGQGIGLLDFATDSCSFTMRMRGPTNTLEGVRGTIYDGQLRGEATFVVPPGRATNIQYVVKASVKKADFEKLTSVLIKAKKKEDYKGTFSGRVTVAGQTGIGQGKTATGAGSIQIEDGRVFMLPVFGGLSKMMTKMIPGLDFVLRQSNAQADFVIVDRKLHSDRVQIQGNVLSLTGYGDYYFNEKLDINVRLRLMKNFWSLLFDVPTYLLSKLFEFRLTGTIREPQWYLVNLERLGLRREEKSVPAEEAESGRDNGPATPPEESGP